MLRASLSTTSGGRWLALAGLAVTAAFSACSDVATAPEMTSLPTRRWPVGLGRHARGHRHHSRRRYAGNDPQGRGSGCPSFTLITRNRFGTLVGGAEFDFFVEWGNWNLRFMDGNPSYDESPGANGIVTYSPGWPNKFRICETSPPSKTILTIDA